MENIHNKDIKDWGDLFGDVWQDFTEIQKLELAIDIFNKRITGRYLEPINILLKSGQNFAFAVISIDCLLIETLQSFYDWLPESNWRSRKLFNKFLTTSLFGSYFNNINAEVFYNNFRCWLLHQWEIFEKSLISEDQDEIIRNISDWLIVNYRKFHQLLLSEFADYLKRLYDPKEVDLRNNFIKKMAVIYR
jgi:hypothetical protein